MCLLCSRQKAERSAKEAGSEFESVTRLIKNEYGRFEDERIDDFKAMLESYVEGMIHRQKTVSLKAPLTLWSRSD